VRDRGNRIRATQHGMPPPCLRPRVAIPGGLDATGLPRTTRTTSCSPCGTQHRAFRPLWSTAGQPPTLTAEALKVLPVRHRLLPSRGLGRRLA
jgi:hypothetical protein